jgi:ABC-2 type transport system permease protein
VSAVLFLVAKTLRFLFFFLFLLHLIGNTKGLLGFTRDQAVLFFLVWNIVDITTQLFFRGVYFFRQKVVNGELDFYLSKPMNPLFRVLTGNTDPLDLTTLVALAIFIVWFLPRSSLAISPQAVSLFLLLLSASFLIALAFHITVVAIGIIALEVDHTIMIYRDITQMARFPIDIYTEPLRSILTFALPVAIMFTVPAKALMGLVSFPIVLLSLLLTACSLFLSLRLWRYALTKYSSASS